jgi:hypothetical protein
MLGHEDVCPQGEIELYASLIDGFFEPQARSLGVEKRVAVVTRKGERVGVSRIIAVLSMTALGV